MARVFIGYRRADGQHPVGWVEEPLRVTDPPEPLPPFADLLAVHLEATTVASTSPTAPNTERIRR